MTREEAIDWLEHAQNGLTGHIGEALRMAIRDMQTMSGTVQKDEKTAEDACTDGACPIHYKEDL